MAAPTYRLPVTGSASPATSREAHEAAVQSVADVLYEELGAIATGLRPAGAWDATSGTFPEGAVRGSYYFVSGAGIVDGQAFAVGDWLVPLVEDASTSSFAGNWTRGDYSKVVKPVYADVAQLLATEEPSRGVGKVWQTPEISYREAPAGGTGHDLVTASGVLLQALPAPGRVWQVDAFGPACDGVTSDAPAIEAALARLEEGDTLRLTPGRTYWVDRMIRRDGVSFTFDYRGATIAVMDDSVWHVFRFSGTVEAPIAWVKVLHGKFDGRMHRQRHWPNQALRTGQTLSDGSDDPLNGHVIQYRRNGRFAYHSASETYYTWSDITGGPEDGIVGRVLTEFTGDPGDFFHANSEINGLSWQDGWMNGSAGDGINVYAGGNDGLIGIYYALLAWHDFSEGGEITGAVRNGIMAWGCDRVFVMEPYIHDCLQTNLHELAMLFNGAGAYEAAAIKVSGYNASGRSNPLTGYSRNVIIQGGKVERVTMPIFYRSQTPKPEDTGAHISVEGFKAYDCSRDVWFEVASSVRINHCELIRTFVRGASQPRANGVLFFGNGTRQFTVTNCEIYGRINTNEKQNLTLGLVANSILQEEAEAGGDPVFDGTHLRDVIIESYGRQGFRADHASGVTLISDGPRSQVRYQGQVAAGRLRWQGALTEKLMTEGQTEITGLAGIYHISRIRRRNPKLAGGKWFPVHSSDYTAYAALGTVVFALGAEAGDMVQIEWSARHDESFVAGAGQTVFTGSQPGGHRVADMNSVRIDNVAVPSRGSVADPATDPHWTLAVSLDGLPIVTLVNHPALAGGEVVRLVYRPPLQPYASAGTVGGDRPTALHLAAVNVGASRISGDAVLRGSVTDCAETCFEVDDGVALDLDRVDVLRAAHGVVRPTGSGVMRALRARGGIWKNWGMASGRVGTETHLRYAVGGNRPANMLGPQEDLQFDGVTFWRDRNEGPASAACGGNTNSSADRAAYSRRTGCEFINTSGLVSTSGTVGTLETPTVLTL